jgi:hypothetical protein
MKDRVRSLGREVQNEMGESPDGIAEGGGADGETLGRNRLDGEGLALR